MQLNGKEEVTPDRNVTTASKMASRLDRIGK